MPGYTTDAGLSLRRLVDKEGSGNAVLVCHHKREGRQHWIFLEPWNPRFNLDKYDMDAEVWVLVSSFSRAANQ